MDAKFSHKEPAEEQSIWHKLQRFAEVMDYSESDYLIARLKLVEQRLVALEQQVGISED